MDPDLADEWTTMAPIRDHACTAIGNASERNKDAPHHGALRYPVGLREGWEDRLATARAKRAAADQARQH
jgi:hypothetical protein